MPGTRGTRSLAQSLTEGVRLGPAQLLQFISVLSSATELKHNAEILLYNRKPELHAGKVALSQFTAVNGPKYSILSLTNDTKRK